MEFFEELADFFVPMLFIPVISTMFMRSKSDDRVIIH